MDDRTPEGNELADASAALWLLGALIVGVAAFLAMGYARHAARQPQRGARATPLATAGAALGTGCWAAMLLDICSQPLAAPPAFRAMLLVAAWALAASSSGAALALAALLRRPAAAVGASVLLAVGVVSTQWSLLAAAGLAPGVEGRLDALTMAVPVVVSGCLGGLWVAYLGAGRSGRRRVAWRVAAAALLAVAVIAGQELVGAAADISSHARQGAQRQVPAAAVCLVAGLVVPMLLLAAAVDLRMRRRKLQPSAAPLPGQQRRRARKRSRLDG